MQGLSFPLLPSPPFPAFLCCFSFLFCCLFFSISLLLNEFDFAIFVPKIYLFFIMNISYFCKSNFHGN